MDIPQTRYAKTVDGYNIAYQVVGDGPVDLVYLNPWFSHLEVGWEDTNETKFLNTFASFSRLILFDRRGSGMSDPMPQNQPPPLEDRMDDVRAVMDAAGSERAVIYGASESGAMAALFAATYPDRTIALIIYASKARSAWAPDYPWGETEEQHKIEVARIQSKWGTEEYWYGLFGELADEPDVVRWLAKLSRMSMSPGAAAAYEELYWQIDVREALPLIHVPTLIVNREQDMPDHNRYLAEHIPGAEHVLLPGIAHLPITSQELITDEIARFVRKVQNEESDLDRALATVMFTDIVGSTSKAASLGDREWSDLVSKHHSTVRGLLARYRGREVDTAGDGFFATFDGPARGVRCAQQIVSAVAPLGVEVRAGVHTGECTTIDGKVGGLGVVIGSRVGGLASPSEVLVSSTVKDLVAGSGLVFEDAGEHELKGVPDMWHLYRAVG
jgi:class 3 adenylate cyclase